MKIVDGVDLYLVKWQGYGMKETTWEPIENLQGDEACKCDVPFILYRVIFI
jgi:hypothetical protein